MCITIFTSDEQRPYDMGHPLEEQLNGCKEITIDFRPHDPSVEKFLDEIERFASRGLTYKLNIKVIHNNEILGAKIKRQVKKVETSLTVNELIKLMALTYDIADRKLEEISNFCMEKANEQ